MNDHSSTFRVSADRTYGDGGSRQAAADLRAEVVKLRESSSTSVARLLDAFPQLTSDKAFVLDLAVDEFRKRRQEVPSLAVEEYCREFRGLGASLSHSIMRAVDVQDFIDRHPEFLQLVGEFEWPTIGDHLHNFQIVEELGRGSLARVYLCNESGVGGRTVVVKVARGGEYEADLLGRLDHTGIVPIYSVTNDSERGVSFICMPFRGRRTLQDVVCQIEKNGVPRGAEVFAELTPAPNGHAGSRGSYVDRSLQVAWEIADALAHAHDRDVVHGDLKPSNVLLTDAGEPMLIDFNLAKVRDSTAGPRGGTLSYMAPEILAGIGGVDSVPHYDDAASDIFSFGVLVYQLLTGTVPFRLTVEPNDPADAARGLLSRQQAPLVAMQSLNPDLNVALDRIVADCLDFIPARRPESMHEVRDAIRKQLKAPARTRRKIRANPKRVAAVALAVSIVLTGWGFHLATRSPYHERQLARGIALLENGAAQRAVPYFDRALESAPEFNAARFARAKAHLATGNAEDALKDFSRCNAAAKDANTSALMGYCSNLNQNHSGAIASYESAIAQGNRSVEVLNNLGVSYAYGRSRLGHIQRFDAAMKCLREALEIRPDSALVHQNILVVGLMRAGLDPAFELESLIEHLHFVQHAAPARVDAHSLAIDLYARLSLKNEQYVGICLEAIESALRHNTGPKSETLLQNPLFEAIRADSRFADIVALSNKTKKRVPLGRRKLFMEPGGNVSAAIAAR
jgi:serine/threonine protein kinase